MTTAGTMDSSEATASSTRKAAEEGRQCCQILLAGLGPLARRVIPALEGEGLEHTAFRRPPDALEAAGTANPELAVVGVSLPGWDPLSFLEELSTTNPHLQILFLCDRAEVGFALEALKRGAHDILPPPHPVASILLRVRMLQAKRRIGSPHPPDAGSPPQPSLLVDPESKAVQLRGTTIRLTAREFSVLDRLIQADGSPVSREAILSDVWGEAQESPAVLDATVHRLRRKLEDEPSSPRVVTTVRGRGYRIDLQVATNGLSAPKA